MLLLALSELALGRWVDGLSGGLLLMPHERWCGSASVKHSHTRGHMPTILWPRVPADRELALGLAPVAKGIPSDITAMHKSVLYAVKGNWQPDDSLTRKSMAYSLHHPHHQPGQSRPHPAARRISVRLEKPP